MELQRQVVGSLPLIILMHHGYGDSGSGAGTLIGEAEERLAFYSHPELIAETQGVYDP